MVKMNVCEEEYKIFRDLCTGKQKKFYEWMLANGKAFQGRTLDKKERAWLQNKVSRKLFTMRMCFIQSQTGCIDGELRYFEGRATTKSLSLPLEHAWLVDKEGRVWDATWKDGMDYFGVEIPTSFVREGLQTGYANYLLAKYYTLHV